MQQEAESSCRPDPAITSDLDTDVLDNVRISELICLVEGGRDDEERERANRTTNESQLFQQMTRTRHFIRYRPDVMPNVQYLSLCIMNGKHLHVL